MYYIPDINTWVAKWFSKCFCCKSGAILKLLACRISILQSHRWISILNFGNPYKDIWIPLASLHCGNGERRGGSRYCRRLNPNCLIRLVRLRQGCRTHKTSNSAWPAKYCANFYCTFLHPRSFNILCRLGIGAKRKTSENHWFSEEFVSLIDPLVTPERLWIFCQLTGVQYVYLSQNAERTLLGHLSASAIFNNLRPCRCKNSITKITLFGGFTTAQTVKSSD